MFLEKFQEKILRGRPPETGEVLRWMKLVNPFKEESDIELLVEGDTKLGAAEALVRLGRGDFSPAASAVVSSGIDSQPMILSLS